MRYNVYMTTTSSTSTTTTHDTGNGETIETGHACNPWGVTAFTHSATRTFKTERGAIAWLARRGYAADGTRLPEPTPGQRHAGEPCRWAHERGCRGRLVGERCATIAPGRYRPDPAGDIVILTCSRCGQAHGKVTFRSLVPEAG